MSDLCTLDDVRQFLEEETDDTSRDELIQAQISRASAVIMQEVQREFAPASSGVTRTFRWDRDRILDLAPYDIRTISSVTLSPEGTSSLLNAGTDYIGSPVEQPDGVYTAIRMSNLLLVRTSTLLFRFGFMQVQVVGDWGFATVPAAVEEACVETVASWMRRDVAAFAMNDLHGPEEIVGPAAAPYYSIPPSALRKLNPYRRWAGVI